MTMRDEVRIRIQDAILNKRLAPGERIVETKIAEELGVSQSPVREAIRELELMGLVESKPFLGTYVKVMTKKDINDVYVMRAELEEYATTEATKNIDEKSLENLKNLLIKMDASVKNKNFEEYTKYDNEFHKAILEAADNSMLERFWKLGLLQWTFVTTSRITEKDFKLEIKIHNEIYESMVKRDAQKAGSQAKDNVLKLKDKILLKIKLDEDNISIDTV